MNTNNAKETADAERAMAKQLLNAAFGLPVDTHNNSIDRAIDCIINAAILEVTSGLSEALREQAEARK